VFLPLIIVKKYPLDVTKLKGMVLWWIVKNSHKFPHYLQRPANSFESTCQLKTADFKLFIFRKESIAGKHSISDSTRGVEIDKIIASMIVDKESLSLRKSYGNIRRVWEKIYRLFY
jgi:hypothetical protein